MNDAISQDYREKFDKEVAKANGNRFEYRLNRNRNSKLEKKTYHIFEKKSGDYDDKSICEKMTLSESEHQEFVDAHDDAARAKCLPLGRQVCGICISHLYGNEAESVIAEASETHDIDAISDCLNSAGISHVVVKANKLLS